jgi:hypothetical protein
LHSAAQSSAHRPRHAAQRRRGRCRAGQGSALAARPIL